MTTPEKLTDFIPVTLEQKTILHFLRIADYNRDVIREIFDRNDVPGTITALAYILAMLTTYHEDVEAAFNDAFAALKQLYPEFVRQALEDGAPAGVPLVIIPETGYSQTKPVLDLTPAEVAMAEDNTSQKHIVH